jgi:hypothetical protein
MALRVADNEDWTPPPGTEKRVCLGKCHQPFASRGGARYCATCLATGRIASSTVFDGVPGEALRPARPIRGDRGR